MKTIADFFRGTSSAEPAPSARSAIANAVEDAQRAHQRLAQQAAAVIGNQRQLELKLARANLQLSEQRSSIRAAQASADDATSAADAESHRARARSLGSQLLTAEESVRSLTDAHQRAIAEAERAVSIVHDHANLLQNTISERTAILQAIEQSRMQQQAAHSLSDMQSRVAGPDGGSIDRVDQMYARALSRHTGRDRVSTLAGRARSERLTALREAGRRRAESGARPAPAADGTTGSP